MKKTLSNIRFFLPVMFLAASLSMESCEQYVTDFEIKDTPTRLVLNSILYPDSIVRVHLSESRSVNHYNQPVEYVRDAEVMFYENGNPVGLLQHTENGNYEIDYYPVPGATYRVEVRAGDFPEISAQTVVPQPPVILQVDTVYEKKIWSYQDFTLTCRIHFNTGVESTNYYALSISLLVNVYEYVQNPDGSGTWEEIWAGTRMSSHQIQSVSKQFDFYQDEGYQLFDIDDDPYAHRLYFSDKFITGNKTSLPFTIGFYYWRQNYNDTVTVWLDAYDEALYKHLYSLAKKNYIGDDPFSEKISVYSNVENGLGLFGSASSSGYEMQVFFPEVEE